MTAGLEHQLPHESEKKKCVKKVDGCTSSWNIAMSHLYVL